MSHKPLLSSVDHWGFKKKLSSKKQATSAYIEVITSQKTRQSLPMIIIITTTTFYKYTYRNRATQFILVEVCAVN